MTKEEIINNIYDLIKVCALPKNQNDDWAQLSRKHAKEAAKEMRIYLENKNISVDNEIILIGKHIKITVENI